MNCWWKTWTMLALLGTPALAQPNYLVEAKILSMDTNAMNANEKITLTGDRLTVHTNGEWRMLMEPGKSADDLIAKLEKQKGVDVLSAPKLLTPEAQVATIQIGQSLRYLVALSNDLYRAVQLPDEKNPGVHLSVIVTRSTTTSNAVKLDMKFRSNLIEAMMDLPGFPGHKLGEPVISSRAIETVLEAPLDAWVVVGGNKVEQIKERKSEMLVVLLRVSTRSIDARTGDSAPVPALK